MNSRLRTFKHSQLALVLVSLFGASAVIEAAPIKVAHADEPEDNQSKVYTPQVDTQDPSEPIIEQEPRLNKIKAQNAYSAKPNLILYTSTCS